jgi:hypothetical protein
VLTYGGSGGRDLVRNGVLDGVAVASVQALGFVDSADASPVYMTTVHEQKHALHACFAAHLKGALTAHSNDRCMGSEALLLDASGAVLFDDVSQFDSGLDTKLVWLPIHVEHEGGAVYGRKVVKRATPVPCTQCQETHRGMCVADTRLSRVKGRYLYTIPETFYGYAQLFDNAYYPDDTPYYRVACTPAVSSAQADADAVQDRGRPQRDARKLPGGRSSSHVYTGRGDKAGRGKHLKRDSATTHIIPDICWSCHNGTLSWFSEDV